MFEAHEECKKIQNDLFDIKMREISMILGEEWKDVDVMVQDLIGGH